MATTEATAERASARVHVQKFGTFLSNMVMPNIGAFIAWGLITALFIEVGWVNKIAQAMGSEGNWTWLQRLGGFGIDPATCTNIVLGAGGTEHTLSGFEACSGYGGIVGPMITYLLPLLIGYTGGYNIYKTRGGVVGAIATMGVIAGTSIPMFMGAMIMGPLGGWSMKKLDALWDGKIRPGFEMLVNNFSAGIWGMILAVFGFFVMSPIVTWVADRLGEAVDWLVGNSLLPLTSVIIEPAKVLFLNNALNHGVLTPLGSDQVTESGKSVLFLLEANPAGGLGLLLAYMFFGKGMAKASAPGAAIIHFFGGIHEIYFPYVLMKPKLILAMIAGGMAQIFVNVLFGTGLVSPAAPGSIFAVMAVTAPGDHVGVIASVIAGAAVSFGVAAVMLKMDKSEDDGDLTAATESMESMKGKKSSVSGALTGSGVAATDRGPIKDIVFACDAGMGSSAMGASVLRKKVHAAGYTDVTVVNRAIANLTDDFDLVVSHQDLTPRAQQRTGSAIHVSVDNFMASPKYDEIVDLLHTTNGSGDDAASGAAVPATAAPDAEPAAGSGDVLPTDSIVLSGAATNRDDAITEAGRLLVASGAVEESYVAAMLEREQSVSTYMGNLLAIPHGTNEAKAAIRRTAISFVRYPGGLDWKGKEVKYVVGIAGAGNDHLSLLGKIAEVFLDEEQAARLERAESQQEIKEILGGVKV